MDFKRDKANFCSRYDSGESMLQVAQRIYNLLDEIKAQASERTCMLVAHNGIARVVHSYFYDMTNEAYAAHGIKNCAIVRYDFSAIQVQRDFRFRTVKVDDEDRVAAIEQICFPPHEACTPERMRERVHKAGECFLVA